MTISLPCTSGIRPSWILHAVKSGFDGIFIASDGIECAYLQDCAERSAQIVTRSQELLSANGFEPQRVRLGAICSVCAEPFTTYVHEFFEALTELGPVRSAIA
jgi:coenzyme F420-reducing hydrogenase delta subunit